MGLWGSSNAYSDRPKFLPQDSNAEGAGGAREHVVAVSGGWGLAPGKKYSGNDNADAQPEVLVCIRNFSAQFGTATVQSIDWSDGAVANTGTFDIIVTFDEPVNITSAAWSGNQTVTNKAYILLSRLGQTDMVEDSTMACMYYEGSGTNQLTFRGTAQTNAAAAFIGFNGAGVGDDAFSTGIIFDGTSALNEEDGNSVLGLRQEAGTAAAPSFGDSIILNATAGAVATVNGALSGSTTLVVDTVTGTLAVGQVITVKDTSALSISDALSDTGLSTDNTLTITAVASQTSVTVSEAITVANNVVLLASTNGGDEILADGLSLTVAGPTFATRSDITLAARSGGALGGNILLETATPDSNDGESHITLDTDADSGDSLDLEDFTSGVASYSQAGSSSGTAFVLSGIDIAAA